MSKESPRLEEQSWKGKESPRFIEQPWKSTDDIDRREVLRYLGYGRHEADPAVTEMVEQCIAELGRDAQPRFLHREYPLVLGEEDRVDGGCFAARSRNLSRNLKDCAQVIVFAATLGTGADYLIQKYNRLQMSKAVIMQAAATAMIEEYCDQVCSGLRAEYETCGLYLRPRFSPGYGDFPLDCQKRLLDSLEAGKRIGIKLTDSLLMMPSKSVTAVMGVSRKPYRCEVKGCEVCTKKDCAYRR